MTQQITLDDVKHEVQFAKERLAEATVYGVMPVDLVEYGVEYFRDVSLALDDAINEGVDDDNVDLERISHLVWTREDVRDVHKVFRFLSSQPRWD